MRVDMEVAANVEELARRAAELFVLESREAARTKGRLTVDYNSKD